MLTRIARLEKDLRSVGLRLGTMAPLALGGMVMCEAPAAAQSHQIVVTVHEIKALDRADVASRGDFFAQITIAGDAKATPVVKTPTQAPGSIRPDWKVTSSVKPGRNAVKIELFDKDLAKDDPIDINRLDNRRILEFTVDTRSCRIDGFASAYRCKSRIVRAGKERKAAEITFSVDVKK
jgi:hypothetical protein